MRLSKAPAEIPVQREFDGMSLQVAEIKGSIWSVLLNWHWIFVNRAESPQFLSESSLK